MRPGILTRRAKVRGAEENVVQEAYVPGGYSLAGDSARNTHIKTFSPLDPLAWKTNLKIPPIRF